MSRSPRPRVFISHASCDSYVARKIEGDVRKAGADTFLDAKNVAHGDVFDDKIIDGACGCTELVVLLTKAALERKYIWLEVGMFLGRRKRVVVVLYGVTKEDLATNQYLPVAVKRISAVELDALDHYVAQLRQRVRAWRAGVASSRSRRRDTKTGRVKKSAKRPSAPKTRERS